MRILITGTSQGIGLAVANYFLDKGFEVIGIDRLPSKITNSHYKHFEVNVVNKDDLPRFNDIDYLFINAGTQNEHDLLNNLVGAMNTAEQYAFGKNIKSVLFNASASARSGFEFPEYVASKAGVVGYMKNLAVKVSKNGVTCNSISLGGVLTDSNKPVMEDKECWQKIMDITPLKKWMSLDEVCEWVYFLLVINKSMTGQDILIDNGEYNLNSTFVWPE